MKFLLFAILALALTACSAGQTPQTLGVSETPNVSSSTLPTIKDLPQVELSNFGPAPELTNEVWLNTDAPLRLADLRGKVVLIDFWTFG